jgi:hypothetical protein
MTPHYFSWRKPAPQSERMESMDLAKLLSQVGDKIEVSINLGPLYLTFRPRKPMSALCQ